MTQTTAAELRKDRLAAYEYTRLPDGDPVKTDLRPDYLAALARHHQIKAEIVPLISAWHRQGIEVLLYKGFFLAEFVYPAPGSRFHGDIDVLLRPEDTERALDIATSLGWAERNNTAAQGRNWHQDAFTVDRPGGAAEVDCHRLVIRQSLPGHPGPRALSAAFWAAAIPTPWEGTTVRLPTPADSILIGLILDRCVGEGWKGFKPHDAIDLRLLLERGATLEGLRARARGLGIARTFEHAWSLYDPVHGTLTAPLERSRPWARIVSMMETGAIRIPDSRSRLLRGPSLAWDVAKNLPGILRVLRVLKAKRDVRDVLASITPTQPATIRSSRRVRWRTVRAIKWAFRLFPLGNREGNCLPQSLAIYAALKRQGWPVTFASGVRRTDGGILGHAWVELGGNQLPELSEPGPAPEYTPNFRYP